MTRLTIVAKPVEAIKPTDATWEEWLRFGISVGSLLLAIEGLCT